jgi:hypothetical protein
MGALAPAHAVIPIIKYPQLSLIEVIMCIMGRGCHLPNGKM